MVDVSFHYKWVPYILAAVPTLRIMQRPLICPLGGFTLSIILYGPLWGSVVGVGSIPLIRPSAFAAYFLPCKFGQMRVVLDHGFSTSKATFLGCIILCCGQISCVFWDIQQQSWLLPISSDNPPVVTIKNVFRHFQMFPGRQHCSFLRTSVLGG